MNNKIEISNLCKKIGNKIILEQISFEARAGRVTAFLGPNGAGKSTTLRILLGLDYATSGEATISGSSYASLSRPLLKVGASFDGIGAPPDRSVYRHLKIISISNGISESRIDEVLSLTEMLHKKSALIGTLSLGEGQRLGIATALLGNPNFLILDEPTNGLDPGGIRWFREFIKNQGKIGKTILLSSHILSEVEAVTDDVVIISKGKIIAQGELKEITSNLSSLEEVFFQLTDGGMNHA